MPQNQSFAKLLKEIRGLKQLSQSEAAAQAGISVDTWRAWEQERFEPHLEMIANLIRFLGPHAHHILEATGLGNEELKRLSSEKRLPYADLHRMLAELLEAGPEPVRDRLIERIEEDHAKYLKHSKRRKP